MNGFTTPAAVGYGMGMQIDIVSDTVCPWCLIGKRRLARALETWTGAPPDIRWRPYQLAPELPVEGMARDDYLAAKFGASEQAAAIFDRIAEEGRSEGIAFRFDRIARAPNTLDSHRLIRWAGTADCQDAVVEDLFRAYFTDGRDISDHDVLSGIAARNGMDGPLVARLLAEDRDRDLVSDEVSTARRLGISGVPTFIFDSALAVSGAQPPKALLAAMTEAAGQ
mgnify:CR=1 FL=1